MIDMIEMLGSLGLNSEVKQTGFSLAEIDFTLDAARDAKNNLRDDSEYQRLSRWAFALRV